jgi:hypothetical protein
MIAKSMGTESAQLRKRIAQRGVAAKNDATVISLVEPVAMNERPFKRARFNFMKNIPPLRASISNVAGRRRNPASLQRFS